MGFLQIFAAILTEEAILYTLSFLQGYKFVEYISIYVGKEYK